MEKITIYTDGSCNPNPGAGGWGAIFINERGEQSELYGGEKNATNNQMEMMAAVMALEALESRCYITLYTDSQYVRKGITSWIKGWKRNGWKTASRKPVKNQELWIRLDELTRKHSIQWKWIKGHSGNDGNERADTLANRGREECLSGESKGSAITLQSDLEKCLALAKKLTPTDRATLKKVLNDD